MNPTPTFAPVVVRWSSTLAYRSDQVDQSEVDAGQADDKLFYTEGVVHRTLPFSLLLG
jgi:hypothetical protein